jgi:hypothetical protein
MRHPVYAIMTRPTRIVGTISYLPLRPLAPICFAIDCGPCLPQAGFRPPSSLECGSLAAALRLQPHPQLSVFTRRGPALLDPMPASSRLAARSSTRASAGGAPQFSPARKGWERKRHSPQRRRCGTHLPSHLKFPSHSFSRCWFFSIVSRPCAALRPLACVWSSAFLPFTPRVTTPSPPVLTYLLPHSAPRSRPRAQHPSSLWRSQRPHRRHSR